MNRRTSSGAQHAALSCTEPVALQLARGGAAAAARAACAFLTGSTSFVKVTVHPWVVHGAALSQPKAACTQSSAHSRGHTARPAHLPGRTPSVIGRPTGRLPTSLSFAKCFAHLRMVLRCGFRETLGFSDCSPWKARRARAWLRARASCSPGPGPQWGRLQQAAATAEWLRQRQAPRTSRFRRRPYY